MSTKPAIQTQCPVCTKRYDVPAAAIGHRAKCPKCRNVFRVVERLRRPTEEDILRWLSEVEEPDVLEPPPIIGRREDAAAKPAPHPAPQEGRIADPPGGWRRADAPERECMSSRTACADRGRPQT